MSESTFSCAAPHLFDQIRFCQNAINFVYIQLKLYSSNTDSSFTIMMANSNSFLSPYEILPIAQENKYLGIFFLFYHKIV